MSDHGVTYSTLESIVHALESIIEQPTPLGLLVIVRPALLARRVTNRTYLIGHPAKKCDLGRVER